MIIIKRPITQDNPGCSHLMCDSDDKKVLTDKMCGVSDMTWFIKSASVWQEE